jgi:alpha-L-rhamnosidase
MAPMPPAERSGFLARVNGSAGWGDAIVLVPWELYQEYGDARLLEQRWPAMVRWLDFVERTAAGQRHPSRVAARPEPAAHERYLWDAGFHWGEWLVPGEDLSDFAAFAAANKSDVATAYFARTTGVAAQIARVLGRDGDARRYAALSAAVAGAWRQEFLGPAGDVRPENQANLVRALTFGLVPADLRRAPVTGWPSWSGTTGRTWPPGSWPRRICCRRWPTPVTWTSRTTCCTRTRRRPGWR